VALQQLSLTEDRIAAARRSTTATSATCAEAAVERVVPKIAV
jgi:hypothetical protein